MKQSNQKTGLKIHYLQSMLNGMTEKQPCVYIMTNHVCGTLYTGVTSNLVQRIFQHKERLGNGFTKRYDCHILVYYELHGCMESAISREKQIKAGSRKKKIQLIEQLNPNWSDLYVELF